ncbi:MAG: hypothetical protein AAGK23_12575 [Pseudomonadota bacterium]
MTDQNVHSFPVKRARGRPQSTRPGAIDPASISQFCAGIDFEDQDQTAPTRINLEVPFWLRKLLKRVANDSDSSVKELILDALEKRGLPTTEQSVRRQLDGPND